MNTIKKRPIEQFELSPSYYIDFFMGKYKFKIGDYDFKLLTNTPYDKVIYQHGESINQ
jgi:hypothetical protein